MPGAVSATIALENRRCGLAKDAAAKVDRQRERARRAGRCGDKSSSMSWN
jgi:hypothetical protein